MARLASSVNGSKSDPTSSPSGSLALESGCGGRASTPVPLSAPARRAARFRPARPTWRASRGISSLSSGAARRCVGTRARPSPFRGPVHAQGAPRGTVRARRCGRRAHPAAQQCRATRVDAAATTQPGPCRTARAPPPHRRARVEGGEGAGDDVVDEVAEDASEPVVQRPAGRHRQPRQRTREDEPDSG